MTTTKKVKYANTTLVIHKMNVFAANDLLNRCLGAIAPIFSLAGERITGEKISEAVKEALNALPAPERERILFKDLLGTVKLEDDTALVATVQETGARTLMAQLDLYDVYQLAGDVVEFNYARFFESGKRALGDVSASRKIQ